MKNIVVLGLCVIAFGCQKSSDIRQGPIWGDQRPLKTVIGDSKNQFSVISSSLLNGSPLTESQNSNPDNLIIGFPKSLIGQSSIFGGVITGISDTQDENLGMLKMSASAPATVKSYLDEDKRSLVFLGCTTNCAEDSKLSTLFQIPVVGMDENRNEVYLDFSQLGAQLNVLQDMPLGRMMLSPRSSTTTMVDYSPDVLVFETQTQAIRIPNFYDFKSVIKSGDSITLTTRWYLKLQSGFNPFFVTRKPLDEVGFFTTDTATGSLITRFPTNFFKPEQAIAHYYIKNVPLQYREAFAESFRRWNQRLTPLLGVQVFSFEFLEETDVRFRQIAAGDIRYNVLEWDLINKAPYGGLGPSVAHPLTGEIFNAGVMIQGPTIVETYQAWFQASSKSKELLASGKKAESKKVLADFFRSAQKQRNVTQTQLQLGTSLKFHVPSEDQRKFDPVRVPMPFETPPEGYDYDRYMFGYFVDMVTHELGHNLGLRHNFRGSLGAHGEAQQGSVSRSIMEYLGRSFRHLTDVGEYDVMAIAYGYKGIMPTQKDWYCSEENLSSPFTPLESAECSDIDATSDPYGYFETQMSRVIDLLTAPDSTEAPLFSSVDLSKQIQDFVSGLANYAQSAPATSNRWTQFNLAADRPRDPTQITEFVIQRLGSQVCSEKLAQAAKAKTTESARNITEENIQTFRLGVRYILSSYAKPYPLLNNPALSCLIQVDAPSAND